MADQDQSTMQTRIKNTPQWLTFAIGSGAFAATNGVFAKLTTATHTHDLAAWISRLFGFEEANTFIEISCRAIFFGLNLLSNAIMWILFTRALTAATSTTRVAILNTSANFMVTAVLGFLIFSESLPLQWWFGAAFLVAGSVVIGAREEKEQPKQGAAANEGGVMLNESSAGADAAAVAAGAGGVVENMVAQQRYKDDVDDEEEHGVISGPGTSKGLAARDHDASSARTPRRRRV